MNYDTLVLHVQGFWKVADAVFQGLWKVLDEGKIVRRSTFVMSWVLTFQSYYFCFRAAEGSGWEPLAIGACFAILTPVTALQGTMFKMYGDWRKADQESSK